MKRSLKYLLIVFLLAVQSTVYAGEISSSFMPEAETKEIIYVDKKSGEFRSKLNASLKKISGVYHISSVGKGDYDKYQNVTWEITAEMEDRKGLLYPLYSITIIKGVNIKYEKRFDYDKQKIFYSVSDSQRNIIEESVFPIKGLTAESATMTYVLKAFIAHRNDKSYRDFYLLSDKAKLYRVTIKPMGKEILDLPSGKVEAIKLRLVPNLGILTGVIGSLIPPTYVWYIDQPPYKWLQYQGMETGIGSTHIRAFTN
ncbi:MAG: DUF3108 domain-containing protein [Candidatus Omnitrophica bacterium]|nr:DUF3108 domain-containing protein [Candidatus Omnitrophota bacterium]